MKDKKGKKMRLCCSKGIRQDCECYEEGMRRQGERIVDKLKSFIANKGRTNIIWKDELIDLVMDLEEE